MATPIFDHAQPNIFQSTFNFHEFPSTCKKQVFSSFCSRDIVNLKILKSDWLRAFWPKSQEADFSQVQDLCNNASNNINFLYRTNSEKTNNQIFQYILKNPIFDPFSIYLGQFFFFKKSRSVMYSTTWTSNIILSFRKTNEPTPRKLLEGRMEGQKDRRTDGQTLIYRTLPATARGPKI